jgi:hypothetical protein
MLVAEFVAELDAVVLAAGRGAQLPHHMHVREDLVSSAVMLYSWSHKGFNCMHQSCPLRECV